MTCLGSPKPAKAEVVSIVRLATRIRETIIRLSDDMMVRIQVKNRESCSMEPSPGLSQLASLRIYDKGISVGPPDR